MKAKISKANGTVIEAEGTVQEIKELLDLPIRYEPLHFQPHTIKYHYGLQDPLTWTVTSNTASEG